MVKYLDTNSSLNLTSGHDDSSKENQKENHQSRRSTNWNSLFSVNEILNFKINKELIKIERYFSFNSLKTVQAFVLNEIGLIKDKSVNSTPGSNSIVENKILQMRALLNQILNLVNSSKSRLPMRKVPGKIS